MKQEQKTVSASVKWSCSVRESAVKYEQYLRSEDTSISLLASLYSSQIPTSCMVHDQGLAQMVPQS
jgi:hypothetical protein